jgi:hypothetical protein
MPHSTPYACRIFFRRAISLVPLILLAGCGSQPQQPASTAAMEQKRDEIPDKQPAVPLPTSAPAPLEGEVEVRLEVTARDDKQYTIAGRTNLPPGTKLMLGLDDPRPRTSRGQISTEVGDGGRFSAGPVGPPEGLPDGVYRATLVVPVPLVQSAQVRAVIGEKGERLRGPLVERDSLGPVVKANTEFTVGGPRAAEEQAKRERVELAELDALCDKCEAAFQRLEAARANKKLDRAGWASLSRTLLGEIGDYRKRVQAEPRPYAATMLGFAAGHLATALIEANPFVAHPDPDLGPFARKEYQSNMTDAREALREWRRQLDAAHPAPKASGKP